LIALREGQEAVSQIDPLARDVRRFRIRVGTDVVPRVGMPTQAGVPAFTAAASAPPPGVTYGWQPVNEQQVELIVQLSPERLAALRNEPLTGEIPAELKSVARVRVRSGTANLPRQNVPQIGPPVTAGVPAASQPTQGTGSAPPTDPSRTAQGASAYGASATGNPQAGASLSTGNPAQTLPNGNPAASMTNNPTGQGVAGSVPATNNATGGASGTTGWPNAAANEPPSPSRYNPPSNPPAMSVTTDPRLATPTNPDYSRAATSPGPAAAAPQYPANAWQTPPPQNPNWQPPDTSWQNTAGQNPAWSNPQPGAPGSQFTSPGINQPAFSSAGQQGLSDPNGSRPADGWTASNGHYTGTQPLVSTSPPWGSPDDRYATERGQPRPNYVPTGASNWGQVPAPSQPPSLSISQPASWPPSLGGLPSQGEMASPFAASSAGSDRWSGSSPAPADRRSDGGGPAVNDTVFLGKVPKKKANDFWEELAASAQDPSLGFLREGRVVSDVAHSDKPWWPLTLAMLALFASMGGNLYLGWIAVDTYRRYLEMADDGDDDELDDSPRRRDDDERWDERPRRRERATVDD